MIAELCPNGVEFVLLQTIADIGTVSSNRVVADEKGFL